MPERGGEVGSKILGFKVSDLGFGVRRLYKASLHLLDLGMTSPLSAPQRLHLSIPRDGIQNQMKP